METIFHLIQALKNVQLFLFVAYLKFLLCPDMPFLNLTDEITT